MKIAFLGPAPPFRGGISNFAMHLADEFSKQKHQIMLFNFRNQYPGLLFPSGNQYDSSSTDLPSVRMLTPYLPHSWSKTLKAIQDWQPDLLIASWWLPFFALSYGYILKRVTCKVVILAHNIIPHEEWLGTRTLLSYAFKSAHKIVVLSRSCLLDLKRTLPNNISRRGVLGFHPIYKPLQLQRYEAQAFPGLLFFGLIKDYKGLDVLLKAMPIIRLAIPDIRLRIVGSVYGSSRIYENMIQELELKANVECHFRYVPDVEVANFFAISDVCILPYKTATQSGVIATALSYETPIIASDVGGLGEYIDHEHTGLLVPPDNPPALAAAVIRFYNEKMMEPMREAIASQKDSNTWAELARLIIE
ncbi:MAG: glycosyltransferase family 4 protein [Candidatus Cloacimonetes bacterium]|nr:glycosyltransferase family 4 protein [Candidatus Cloacimonadota bacterium]MCK9334707.1 glycosyltransferase family 4 protein [Candidatus Cloacimonadota bacterium]MDD2543004.1 glycosyltransferase family 4 protein [Candidatus Cloacimonadota bacterium]MDD2684236.1 glycosyltransferase family 4 protein [Candidatus Cloacimonadota bacterium]MDD3096343.1 glycosyltransferase family 4 protein [Candidatus Cloacimonadota bacterium]